MLELKNKDSFSFENYTVIIPSICVGNAAQLACDLLISSKQLKRVGNITHPAIIPVFGPSAYQHEPNEKTASCEVYESEEEQLGVIQLRTPLISKHAPSFHVELVKLVSKAKRVIILSGSFGFEKRIIEASPYEFKATESFKSAHATQLPLVQWKQFEGEVIYGGGNAMQLFNLLEEQQVPTMLLFRYLLEGDNTLDASMILRELNVLCSDFLQLQEKSGALKLTVPVSWKLLFGNDVIELLF